MTKRKSPYKFAVLSLTVIAVIVLIFAISDVMTVSYLMKHIGYQNSNIDKWRSFKRLSLLYLILPAIEIFVYRYIRDKELNRLFVRLHIWCYFISIFIPVFSSVLYPFLVDAFRNSFNSDSFFKIRRFIVWITFGVAQIFFISTVIKAFTSQKENEVLKQYESADFLNEFTETNQKL